MPPDAWSIWVALKLEMLPGPLLGPVQTLYPCNFTLCALPPPPHPRAGPAHQADGRAMGRMSDGLGMVF